jgi:hypothetical protein
MGEPRKVCYGSLFMERGERWPKVQEQIDGLSASAPGSPIFFDVFCGRRQMEEAISIARRTHEYALSKGMVMEGPPSVSVRIPGGRTVVIAPDEA